MKAEGQPLMFFNVNELAFDSQGELAERLNAPSLHLGSGAHTTARGFESRTRRQIADPTGSWSYRRGKTNTAEAVMASQPHYPANRLWFQGETYSDLSQLPDRDGEGWILRKEASPAIQVPAVREALL